VFLRDEGNDFRVDAGSRLDGGGRIRSLPEICESTHFSTDSLITSKLMPRVSIFIPFSSKARSKAPATNWFM
jgi:hypothetical protein